MNRWDTYRQEHGGWYGLAIEAVAALIVFALKVVVFILIAQWMGVL